MAADRTIVLKMNFLSLFDLGVYDVFYKVQILRRGWKPLMLDSTAHYSPFLFKTFYHGLAHDNEGSAVVTFGGEMLEFTRAVVSTVLGILARQEIPKSQEFNVLQFSHLLLAKIALLLCIKVSDGRRLKGFDDYAISYISTRFRWKEIGRF
ncbi:hypothetical protein IFM89_019127 [Coptis chinensis]|uniref:Uncharacterized protein n=1 Tax=Coptis chinensis TaxID=261450 RepID=A0A835H725_9MAGN|nr:hypothetical protein IFM89_019127 [Coptis chinensis]